MNTATRTQARTYLLTYLDNRLCVARHERVTLNEWRSEDRTDRYVERFARRVMKRGGYLQVNIERVVDTDHGEEFAFVAAHDLDGCISR